LKNGKGLDTKIIKVLPLNQPFSPSSLPSRKNTFSSEFFYGPSFFHEETRKKKRENLHVMKKKTKKHYLYLSSFV